MMKLDGECGFVVHIFLESTRCVLKRLVSFFPLWHSSTIMETAELPNGQVQTLFRTIIHSTPPVNAIAEPRGKINEAFLTVFCRNAEIVEASARNLLRKTHPDRHIKPEASKKK